MPTCITCIHCDLKSEPAMARLGYGHCELDKQAGKFRAFDHEIECEKFERLPKDREESRISWAQGRR